VAARLVRIGVAMGVLHGGLLKSVARTAVAEEDAQDINDAEMLGPVDRGEVGEGSCGRPDVQLYIKGWRTALGWGGGN
jgi:hypothetical protein